MLFLRFHFTQNVVKLKYVLFSNEFIEAIIIKYNNK